jgi:hypothetical protein
MLYDKKWDKAIEQPVLNLWQRHLLNTAKYLRKHGWCQGTLSDDQGGTCLVGAMINTGAGSEAYTKLSKYLGYDYDRGSTTSTSGIVIWNDTYGRTKEEVITALESAALLK